MGLCSDVVGSARGELEAEVGFEFEDEEVEAEFEAVLGGLCLSEVTSSDGEGSSSSGASKPRRILALGEEGSTTMVARILRVRLMGRRDLGVNVSTE